MESSTSPQFGASHFDKVANTYETSTKSSSMEKMISSLLNFSPSITSTSIIHDNACGPGILTSAILSQFQTSPPPTIYSTDISPAMISQVRLKNLGPNIKPSVMDSQNLEFADEMFTHSFTNMGIFLFPDPEKGMREIYRTLRKDGTAIVTSIKRVGWVRIFQDVQNEIRPEEEAWNGPLAKGWGTEWKLREVVMERGFKGGDIEVHIAQGSQKSREMGGFLESMRSVVTGMITKTWSEGERLRFEERLRQAFERELSGEGEFEVVAWVAVARK